MQNVDSTTRPIMIPISIAAAGDNTIIAGITNNNLYIRQLLLTTPGGTNTITLKRGSQTLSTFQINANDGVILETTAQDYPFLFDTRAGEAFIINLSAATSVIGHVVYGQRQ